ncbi:hypothetical protein [Ornithinimicrobium kibberense]|uniref:hypothetical protein n=1 Tax=Ornithinimicrobium kibberense TaxID=282060 RepID=UPI00360FDA3B
MYLSISSTSRASSRRLAPRLKFNTQASRLAQVHTRVAATGASAAVHAAAARASQLRASPRIASKPRCTAD